MAVEKKTVNILFLAAEADPFVKIGGLGDVAGSLPPALRSISMVVNLNMIWMSAWSSRIMEQYINKIILFSP